MISLLAFIGGIVVGYYAIKFRSKYEWSLTTTFGFIFLVDFFVAILITLLTHSYSQASDSLKDTTVHIDIGSGFILETGTGSRYLITNFHVCNMSQWHGVMRGSYQDGQLVQGPVVKTAPVADLCASKVDKTLKALKLAKSLKQGQKIYTRGYPYGILTENSGIYIGRQQWGFVYPLEEIGKCPKGFKEVYDGTQRLRGCSVIYTDNVTNLYSRPGSSGSPVVDSDGNLVGVMSSWDGEHDAGGMVTFEAVKEFLKDL